MEVACIFHYLATVLTVVAVETEVAAQWEALDGGAVVLSVVAVATAGVAPPEALEV